MKNSNDLSHREPSKIKIEYLKFIREHDGKPERVLKDRLANSFKQTDEVQRAYLVQVNSDGEMNVALCLKTQHGLNQNILREVGTIFADIFAKQVHLDILFLSESQESALKSVCSPFYELRNQIST